MRAPARRPLSNIWAALTISVSMGPLAASAEISGLDVNLAIDRGIEFLRGAQRPDGAWFYTSDHEPGLTSLAVLALVTAGVNSEDPAILKALTYIKRHRAGSTYSVALTIMALAEINATQHRKTIRRYAAWLVKAQGVDGTWTYRYERGFAGKGDNSNTQFAVLGLHAARRSGVPVSKRAWSRITQHFIETQNANGGWGYRGQTSSTPSMTAAGLASLMITGDKLFSVSETCGRYVNSRRLAVGLASLSKQWTLDAGKNTHYLYYALERVGIFSGLRFLGRHDWYRELATQLVQTQNAQGGWSGTPEKSHAVIDTCFALLTLAKGKVPVLVNKLQWAGDWNNDRNDMKHLTAFVSRRLEKKVGWQVLPSSAPLEDWMAAPILYMNGHTWPKLAPDEIKKLKEYLDRGGLLFAEACCSRKTFDSGFRALIREHFGGRQLKPLDPGHEIYRTYFRLNPQSVPLEGLSLSCRTSIIYSRRDLSCDWERMDTGRQAFKAGTNLALYAMGAEPLKDKLARVSLAPLERPRSRPLDEVVARGALTIAQIKYQGEWNTDSISIRSLQEFLRQKLNTSTSYDRAEIELTSPDLANYPILYLTGHRAFQFAKAERQALKQYLERGGFLFADACCGRKAFDAAFRKEIAAIFPDRPLKPLPPDHPVFHCGYTVSRLEYRPLVLEEEPGLSEPRLEGIEIDGRARVIYSRYDLGCALENHRCPHCRGIQRPGALELAANIIIYALGF